MVVLHSDKRIMEWRTIREENNMCVGLPAKVKKIKDGVALVEASGATTEVSSDFVEDLEVGDYVMVHAGAAIAKITQADQEEVDDLMEELLR